VPVGEVAAGGDLERAEHAHVEVPAAHHRERVGVVEVRRAGQLRHRHLAGVGEVGVHLSTHCRRSHAEHAVLGVEHDPRLGGEVIGDPRGLADAEVDIGAGRDVASNPGGKLVGRERRPTDMLGRAQRGRHRAPCMA
jgi:hypothetical protein